MRDDQGPRRLEPIAADAARPATSCESQLGGARSGEVWRARDTQTGADRRVQAGRAGVAADAGDARARAARAEAAAARAEPAPRARARLRQGRRTAACSSPASSCDGQPLDRLVAATGPLPLDRAKKIVAQIGEALLEGQKVGVVHHDLSPKNVLIGGDDEVKVINFVAPVAGTETVFGVPEYLSPEQAEGKLVDQRSNTYSLGGIMVLLLTGPAAGLGRGHAARSWTRC